MFLEYTPEQQALRKELREYFAQLLTPEVRAELGASRARAARCSATVVRQMGADGWLGIGWPKEYGGAGPAGDSTSSSSSTRCSAPARRSRS